MRGAAPAVLLAAIAALTTAVGACGGHGSPAVPPAATGRCPPPVAPTARSATTPGWRWRRAAGPGPPRPSTAWPPGSWGPSTPARCATARRGLRRRGQGRPVARVCTRVLPLVAPACKLRASTGPTTAATARSSLRRSPPCPAQPPGGARGRRVTVARDGRRLAGVPIGADGRFATRPLRLRTIADNTFTLAIAAPPAAPRAVSVSAICLDCLAGRSPWSPASPAHHGRR